MITDLDAIKRLAHTNADAYAVLKYQLQADDGLDDSLIDTWIDSLAAPIDAAIDCTQCGNCCRVLDVYLTEADANRLQPVANVPITAIVADASAHGEWGCFVQQPCRFLHGKMCSVYQHRPESCRDYPFFTPNFRWMLDEVIQGAAVCPIIFNTLNAALANVDAFQRTHSE